MLCGQVGHFTSEQPPSNRMGEKCGNGSEQLGQNTGEGGANVPGLQVRAGLVHLDCR